MKYSKIFIFATLFMASCGNGVLQTSSNVEEKESSNGVSQTSSNSEKESSSISNANKEKIDIILPTGSPLFGMSTYLHENSDNLNVEVVNGSDGLMSEFAKGDKDIIVAPINLGANMYAKNQKYQLFETFVWGNLYVASTHQITSFSDLQGKTIAVFGINQIPDIVMNTLAKANNVTFEKYTTDSVEDSTTAFLQKEVEYFVGAEPSLSKFKSSSDNIYTLDLQSEWEKISGIASYPQAAIFVNKEKTNELKSELLNIRKCINDLLTDVDYTVECAMKQNTLSKLGSDVLKLALPNCHFGINSNQKSAIEFYFNKIIDLGLGKNIGGGLPNDEFYISL